MVLLDTLAVFGKNRQILGCDSQDKLSWVVLREGNGRLVDWNSHNTRTVNASSCGLGLAGYAPRGSKMLRIMVLATLSAIRRDLWPMGPVLRWRSHLARKRS